MERELYTSPDDYRTITARMAKGTTVASLAKGEGEIVIIETGLSKDGMWDTQPSAIQDYAKFNKVRICLDHNPSFLHPFDRSAGDIIGLITRAYPSEDGRQIRAKIKITDDKLKEKFLEFKEEDAIEKIQFSMAAQTLIRRPDPVEDEEADLPIQIERILNVYSVDHVLESAYGFATTFQNKKETSMDLEKENKELKATIEKLQAQLEKDNQAKELADKDAQIQDLTQSVKTLLDEKRQNTINAKLASAKLPEAAVNRLKAVINPESTDEQVDKIISDEESYAISLGWKPEGEKEAEVTTLGFGETAPLKADENAKSETEQKRAYLQYKQMYIRMGQSEKLATRMAKLAVYSNAHVEIKE